MRVLRALKLFFQLLTDREIYNLAWVAATNVFRKQPTVTATVETVKKRAKANNAD